MEIRDRIKEKAEELYMKYGIRSVSMDDIAAQLGMSKKTIYQYFADKDELVDAVVEDRDNPYAGRLHAMFPEKRKMPSMKYSSRWMP